MRRLVIEIEQGWQGPDLRPILLARIYQPKKLWPTVREKPVITLSPGTTSELDVADQIKLWMQAKETSLTG